MDLLKTLLVYMTLLTNSAVQQMPAITPVPTQFVTPRPAVTATAVPTAAPVTPSPTAAVLPSPDGAATPAGTTAPKQTKDPLGGLISMGDAGEQVRLVQTRLVELGYLTGQADGVFGKKTKRALEGFQSNNGLKADGIAGKMTLAKLFGDNAVPSAKQKKKATDTPAVDMVFATETPKAVKTAYLVINYKAEDGAILYSERVLLQEGTTTVRSNPEHVKGYTIASPTEIKVQVDDKGLASPNECVFTCKKNEQPTAEPTAPTATAEPKALEATAEPKAAEASAEPKAPETTAEAAVIGLSATDAKPLTLPKQDMPLYTGPGEGYVRAQEGKAVAQGECKAFAADENGWVLVALATADKPLRFGYVLVEQKELTAGLPKLELGNKPLLAPADLVVLEAPAEGAEALYTLPAKGEASVLMYYHADGKVWAYLEMIMPESQKPVRGFVQRALLEP